MSVGLIRPGENKGCEPLVIVGPWLVEEDMSSAKGSGTETGSVTAETATSIGSDSEKLEPEVVKMLIGLVVATGAIGALVLLS